MRCLSDCLFQLFIHCLVPSQEREQNTSEKSSIGFEIDGFGSRGDRIFVMAVDADSLARERGVRVGDEVRGWGWEGRVVTLCCISARYLSLALSPVCM